MRINHPVELIGDSLCALPAIYEVSKYWPVQLYMQNKEVQSLIANPRISFCDRHEHPDLEFNIVPLFGLYHEHMHMAQSYYTQAHLAVPDHIEFPQLNHSEMPKHDIVVAPFSHSDIKNNKLWPLHNWFEVFADFPGRQFTVIGSGKDIEFPTPKNVNFLFGLKLLDVASIISRACLSVTLDNGISHLTSFLGTKHVLLYPQVLPQVWVNNTRPNCFRIRKEPLKLQVNEVTDLIKAAING